VATIIHNAWGGGRVIVFAEQHIHGGRGDWQVKRFFYSWALHCKIEYKFLFTGHQRVKCIIP
jgi:hypothetical protein